MTTKKIASILLLLLCTFIGNAQGIVQEGKIWSQIVYVVESFTISTEHLKIEGDTLIESLAYKKVFRSTNSEQTDWKKYLSIRETTNGSIYFRTDTSKQEYLFFNPNCNISDTLHLYSITSGYDKRRIVPFYLRVVRKDSIILNGQFVKRVLLCDNGVPEMISDYYLEGIGSTAGLLYWDGMLTGGDNYNLICCNENGTLVFHDEKYRSCYYSSNWNSTKEANSTPLIEIAALDEAILRVKFTGTSKGKLSVYNTSGNQVIEQFINQPETMLRLPLSGIYLYRITTSKGEVQTGKVVVK